MDKDMELREFIEKKLDKIIATGEWVGKRVGSLGRTTQKIIIASGVLIVFGIAAFLWALGRGMVKKK